MFKLFQGTGQTLYRMTGNVTRGTNTIIWSLLVLRDSTVVSGDNKGNVQLWDGQTGVLLSTFREHVADVLTLAHSPDENHIFASGVDGKVILIQKTNPIVTNNSNSNSISNSSSNSNSAKKRSRQKSPADSHWAYSYSHRPHTHDVFSLAVCYSPVVTSDVLSSQLASTVTNVDNKNYFLLSGGLDTKVCSYSVHDFSKSRPVWIPSVPANSLVATNSDLSVALVQHRNHCDIWDTSYSSSTRTSRSNSSPEKTAKKAKKRKSSELELSNTTTEETVSESVGCKLRVQIKMKKTDHIHSSALSPDGTLAAVSSYSSGTRLWQVNSNSSVIKVSMPDKLAKDCCHSIRFSNCNNYLTTAQSNGVVTVWTISRTGDEVSLEEHERLSFRNNVNSNSSVRDKSVSSCCHAVKTTVINGNSSFLAVTSCHKEVYIYSLR